MERISWIDKVLNADVLSADDSERRQIYVKYCIAEKAQMVRTCATS